LDEAVSVLLGHGHEGGEEAEGEGGEGSLGVSDSGLGVHEEVDAEGVDTVKDHRALMFDGGGEEEEETKDGFEDFRDSTVILHRRHETGQHVRMHEGVDHPHVDVHVGGEEADDLFTDAGVLGVEEEEEEEGVD
jgi:hypothetical protein